MWPEGLIASKASDVKESLIHNRWASKEKSASKDAPLLSGPAWRKLNRFSHEGTKAGMMDFFVSLAP